MQAFKLPGMAIMVSRGSLTDYSLGILVATAILGCGPSQGPTLGQVSGTVTLDGTPLAHATVLFTPAGMGRTSQGITDGHGRYQLHYLRDIRGANIDQHSVRITTAGEATGSRELLPPRYHTCTELAGLVAAGQNTNNFDLQSR